MYKPKLDTYFETKGINVRFNPLGDNELLVNSFVNDFKHIVGNNKLHNSAYSKYTCYTNLYSLEFRHKQTGFEKLRLEDNKFRNNIFKFIKEPQYSPLLVVDNTNSLITTNYKKELKNSLQSLENILVYYSGGLDSELVCKALLDLGKSFTPVIFQWTNNQGKIINEYDLSYAFKFCVDNNLSPIVKTINVEHLWQTIEFEKLAIDLGILSPQIVTHAHMINVMSEEFPSATHLFGGEVRFRTNYIKDNGEKANLVYLGKVYPSFQNCYYQATEDGGGFGATATCSLYLVGDGTWNVSGNNLNAELGCPTSGTWAVGTFDPNQIEFQSCVLSGGGAGADPENGCTPWIVIGTAGYTACFVSASTPGGSTTQTVSAVFSVQYRNVGDTGPGIGGDIELIATAFN